MAENRVTAVRLNPADLSEVRAARPELADWPVSQLMRAGLLLLAGRELAEAIAGSAAHKRGRKPKADAAA